MLTYFIDLLADTKPYTANNEKHETQHCWNYSDVWKIFMKKCRKLLRL